MGAVGRLDVDGERALGRDGEVGLADGRTVPARRLGDQALAQERAGDLGDSPALERLGQRVDRAALAPGGGRENDDLGVGVWTPPGGKDRFGAPGQAGCSFISGLLCGALARWP